MQAKKEMNVEQEKYPMQVYLQGNGRNEFFSDPHWHGYMEMIYVVRGHGLVGVNGKQHELSKGDMVFLGSKSIHYTRDLEPGSTLCFVICFYPEPIQTALYSAEETNYVNGFLSCFNDGREYKIIRSDKKGEEIAEVIQRMFQAYERKTIGYELDMKGGFYQMISALVRNGFINTGLQDIDSCYAEQFDRVVKYIDTHYMEDIDLAVLSNKMDFSYHYFSKLFKRVVGKSFKQYLDYVRVTTAEKLILDEHLNVTEAANRVGIKDITCFYRIYKRVRGYSPSDFKRLIRKGV